MQFRKNVKKSKETLVAEREGGCSLACADWRKRKIIPFQKSIIALVELGGRISTFMAPNIHFLLISRGEIQER
jgi:hypothetical protein